MTLFATAIDGLRTRRVARVGRCAIVGLLRRPCFAGVVRRPAPGNDTMRGHDRNRALSSRSISTSNLSSSGAQNETASPALPARPVRPTR